MVPEHSIVVPASMDTSRRDISSGKVKVKWKLSLLLPFSSVFHSQLPPSIGRTTAPSGPVKKIVSVRGVTCAEEAKSHGMVKGSRQPDRAQSKGIPVARGSRPMSRVILQGDDVVVDDAGIDEKESSSLMLELSPIWGVALTPIPAIEEFNRKEEFLAVS